MSKTFILLIFILVVGCAPVTVQRTDGPVPLAVRVDDAAYWLEEWSRIRELPADKLKRTLQVWRCYWPRVRNPSVTSPGP